MNKINLQSTRLRIHRLHWLVLLGSIPILLSLSAAFPREPSQAQVLTQQVLSMPVYSSASFRSPLAAAQTEPYDVIVTIDNLDPNPVLVGQPVDVTARVASNQPEVGTPTGLLVIQAGQNQLCQFTLDPSGVGSCTLRFSSSGLTPLKAIYPGHSPFLPGVSNAAYLKVNSPGGDEIVYQHNFETPVGPEWCLRKQDTTPSGRGFLGQFGNKTACLNLTSLPQHQQVSVSFDLYLIRSWNGSQEFAVPGSTFEDRAVPSMIIGPDRWKIEADEQLLMLTTFSNSLGNPQAFPDQYPGQNYPRFTGATEKNTLGYTSDSVYHLTFTFTHNKTSLNLDITAFGLQEISNESWGLDNIIVRCIIPPPNGSGEE